MIKPTKNLITNLDLKLLDAKFTAINDDKTYLTQILQQARKSKISQLPSLIKTNGMLNNSFQNTKTVKNTGSLYTFHSNIDQSSLSGLNQFEAQNLNPHRISEFSCLKDDKTRLLNPMRYSEAQQQNQTDIQAIKQSILQKKKQINSKKNSNFSLFQNEKRKSQKISDQEAEIQKYRRKIEKVKKQNNLIHKQISALYYNKLGQNQKSLKKVRKIQPLKNYEQGKGDSNRDSQFKQNDKAHDYKKFPQKTNSLAGENLKSSKIHTYFLKGKTNFYQNLIDQSPYKEQLAGIHKKIISNNLHKNFQQYLISSGKRVPQFIKKLRN